MLNLNSIDYLYIIYISFFLYKGYSANFINQTFPILAIFSGLYCAYLFSSIVAFYLITPIFKKTISIFNFELSLEKIIAFVIIFMVVNFSINKIAQYLNKALNFLYLNWLNFILGILFALFKALLILYFIIFILDVINFPILKDDFFNSKITFYMLLLKQHLNDLFEKYLKPYQSYI